MKTLGIIAYPLAYLLRGKLLFSDANVLTNYIVC